MDNRINFRWLGALGIELKVDNKILLIDPFLSRPPFHRIFFGRVKPDQTLLSTYIQKADYILISHPHWDHIMDVPEIVRNTKASVYGSKNSCAILEISGVPGDSIHLINPLDTIALRPFLITVHEVQHTQIPFSKVFTGSLAPGLKFPLRLQDYKMDICYSFQIQAGGINIQVGIEPHLPTDVLLISIHEEYSVYSLVKSIQPNLVIPVHWDNFMRSIDKPLTELHKPGGVNLKTFSRIVKTISPRTNILIPQLFESYSLDIYK